MLDAHLENQDTTSDGERLNSFFSSWTPHIHVALSFAGDSHSSRVAIVDTSLLPDAIAVFHTAALCGAGLCQLMYNDEYLIYGPVCGKALHSVRANDIRERGFEDLDRPPSRKERAQAGRDPEEDVTRWELDTALSIGRLFRRPQWGPDATIAVAAIMVAIRLKYAILTPAAGKGVSRYIKAHFTATLWKDIVVAAALRQSLSNPPPLANTEMSTASCGELDDMLRILDHVEMTIVRLNFRPYFW